MATSVDMKLLRTTKFPPEFSQKVDMQKVNVEVLKKWIAKKISDILQNDDDVVIELCFNLIEGERYPDIKRMQIQLTGFLEKDTAPFCKELWKLCLSAQSNPQGVPKELLEAKKLELIQEKIDAEKAASAARVKASDDSRRERDLQQARERERSERDRNRGGPGGNNWQSGRGSQIYDAGRRYGNAQRRSPRSRSPRARNSRDQFYRPQRGTDSYVPNRAPPRQKRYAGRRRGSSASIDSRESRHRSKSRTPPPRHGRSLTRSRSPRRHLPRRASRKRERHRYTSRSRSRSRRRRSVTDSASSRSRSPRKERSPSSDGSLAPRSVRSGARSAGSAVRQKHVSSSRSRSRSPPRRKASGPRLSRSPEGERPPRRRASRTRHRDDRRLSRSLSRSRSPRRRPRERSRSRDQYSRSRSRSRSLDRLSRKRRQSLEIYEPAKRRRNTSSVSSPRDNRKQQADGLEEPHRHEPSRTAGSSNIPVTADVQDSFSDKQASELKEKLLRDKILKMRTASVDQGTK